MIHNHYTVCCKNNQQQSSKFSTLKSAKHEQTPSNTCMLVYQKILSKVITFECLVN